MIRLGQHRTPGSDEDRYEQCSFHPGLSLRGRFEIRCQACSSSSKRLRLLQIERVEALGEPVIDRREEVVSLPPFAAIGRELGKGVRRAQLQGQRRLIPELP